MSIGIHQDIHTLHWVVACTDHGLLWDCPAERDARDLAEQHRIAHAMSEAPATVNAWTR